jgi:peptidoglycan/LPS O-acetylase OafA/YrhL
MAGRLARLLLGRPRGRHAHFDALDGLRGLAVLIVIASHLSLLGFGGALGSNLGGIGKSGVYLFFVLSSFLLTRILLERTPAGFADARLWAAYALRRVLRIWPLFLVVLLSSWAIVSAGVTGWPYQLDTAALLRHLALRDGRSVLWSVPVEFKFYLWLPLLALALAWMASRRWPLALQAGLAVGAVALATWAWPPDATGRNDVRLGPYLVLFLCGGFAAALDRRLGLPGPTRARGGWGVVGVAAAAAFALSVPPVWTLATGRAAGSTLSHHWFVYFGIVWSALLLAVLRGPDWLRRPFAGASMRLVGIVSFSAYLWHMPVVYGLRVLGVRQWPFAPLWALAAILLAAVLSFLVFERPWRDVRLRGG